MSTTSHTKTSSGPGQVMSSSKSHPSKGLNQEPPKFKLNFHASLQKGEEHKAVPASSKGSTAAADTNDCEVNPTETLSEANADATADKSITELWKENKDGAEDSQTESDQNSDEEGDVTKFLSEINKMNMNVMTRKNFVSKRIGELNHELKMLHHSKKTPESLVEYINGQRNMREKMKHVINTGNDDFDKLTFKNPLPPLKGNFSESGLTEFSGVPQPGYFEPVFVTQKTDGYRKEKEREQILEHEKKRDKKERSKLHEADCMPEFEYDQFNGNFDAPMSDYSLSAANAYNYQSREQYDYDNYPVNMYDKS